MGRAKGRIGGPEGGGGAGWDGVGQSGAFAVGGHTGWRPVFPFSCLTTRRRPAARLCRGCFCGTALRDHKNKMTRSPYSGNRVINLATTYSRGTYRPTTIGCTGLNGRVRDGNGWNPRQMVTRKWDSVLRVRDGENEQSLQYSMQGGKLNARNFERFPTRPEGRWGCINRQGH